MVGWYVVVLVVGSDGVGIEYFQCFYFFVVVQLYLVELFDGGFGFEQDFIGFGLYIVCIGLYLVVGVVMDNVEIIVGFGIVVGGWWCCGGCGGGGFCQCWVGSYQGCQCQCQCVWYGVKYVLVFWMLWGICWVLFWWWWCEYCVVVVVFGWIDYVGCFYGFDQLCCMVVVDFQLVLYVGN